MSDNKWYNYLNKGFALIRWIDLIRLAEGYRLIIAGHDAAMRTVSTQTGAYT